MSILAGFKGQVMKIALIVFDTFEDYDLLTSRLDELNVTEVISGTSNGFKMLEKYHSTRRDVIVSIAHGQKLERAYNAIDMTDNILVYTHKKGIKTKHSIAYAKKKNKILYVYDIE